MTSVAQPTCNGIQSIQKQFWRNKMMSWRHGVFLGVEPGVIARSSKATTPEILRLSQCR
jgi:hypothetical protein